MYKEIMCDFNNLREAYRLSHRLKTDSEDVIEFDKNKLYNLNLIRKALLNKEWDKLFEYYRFIIHDPKERIVDAMQYRGRIVQHVLCDNILRPYFEPKLIKENCACRKGKGTDYALNLIKQGLVSFLKQHKTGYVLKIDVKKYFPSIDRTVLKNLLKDFPDEEIKELLYYLIDNSPDEKGLPIGNQSSQWLALYYLNKLDHTIKEKYRIKYCARYMDDYIIIHEDKEYLKKLLAELRQIAKDDLKLEFNGKTQITPLHRGFSFLGWRFVVGKNNKIVKKINHEKKKIRVTHIKEANKLPLDQKKKVFKSYDVYLSKGNTYQFRNYYGINQFIKEFSL